MKRPLALKLFIVLSSIATIISNTQHLNDLWQAKVATPNLPLSYFGGQTAFVLLFGVAIIVLYIGLWRRNRLAYAVAWIFEFYAFYLYFPSPWFYESLTEAVLLLITAKFYLKK